MFPHEIVSASKVAIENREWNTVDYLVKQLYGWMDCPDAHTGKCAASIASLMEHRIEGLKSTNYEMYSKYLRVVHHLYQYAVASLVPKTANL